MTEPGSGSGGAIQRVLASGIAACVDAARVGADHAATPCGDWTVRDLVRHLEVVAGSNVLWTSAALGGRVRRALSDGDQDAFNDEMLERLPDRTTAEHLDRFADLAADHIRLVAATATLPMTELGDGRALTAEDLRARDAGWGEPPSALTREMSWADIHDALAGAERARAP